MREQQLDRADTHSPTEPCILPGCQTPTGVAAAYKQEISSFPAGLAQTFIKGLTVCSVSSKRAGRPVFLCRTVARSRVYPLGATSSTRICHDVAAAQVTIGSKIEQSEVTHASFDLQLCPNRPDVAWT